MTPSRPTSVSTFGVAGAGAGAEPPGLVVDPGAQAASRATRLKRNGNRASGDMAPPGRNRRAALAALDRGQSITERRPLDWPVTVYRGSRPVQADVGLGVLGG